MKKQATKRKASGSGPAKAGKKAKGAAANAKPPLKPLPGKARLVNLSHLWLGKTESRLQPYIPETYKDCLIFRGLDSFNRSQRLRLERIKQNGEPRKGNILKTETVSVSFSPTCCALPALCTYSANIMCAFRISWLQGAIQPTCRERSSLHAEQLVC